MIEQVKTLRGDIERTPLLEDLEESIKNRIPVSGWLMMLSEEEFSKLETPDDEKGLRKSLEEDNSPIPFMILTLHFKKIPEAGSIIKYSDFKNSGATLLTGIILERMRRKGLIEAPKEERRDNNNWVWDITEKGREEVKTSKNLSERESSFLNFMVENEEKYNNK